MTQLQVTHIVRALDNVYLCSNTEDRLALTYSAWCSHHRCKQHREEMK